MTAEGDFGPVRFDLRALRDEAWRGGRYRPHVYFCVVVAALYTLAIAWVLVGFFPSEGWNDVFLTRIAFAMTIYLFLFINVLTILPGPQEVIVTHRRVDLVFGGGKVRSYDFTKPKCHLSIWSSDRPELGPYQIHIRGIFPIRSFISVDARDAILRMARVDGLSVILGKSQGRDVFDIRAP